MPGFLLIRLHPPAWPAGWHGRAHLQLATFAADLSPHPERQSAIAVIGRDHGGQVDLHPAVALRAVSVEPAPARSDLIPTEHAPHRCDRVSSTSARQLLAQRSFVPSGNLAPVRADY